MAEPTHAFSLAHRFANLHMCPHTSHAAPTRSGIDWRHAFITNSVNADSVVTLRAIHESVATGPFPENILKTSLEPDIHVHSQPQPRAFRSFAVQPTVNAIERHIHDRNITRSDSGIPCVHGGAPVLSMPILRGVLCVLGTHDMAAQYRIWSLRGEAPQC